MKKTIAIILALVLTLSAVSFAAAAEEEIQSPRRWVPP